MTDSLPVVKMYRASSMSSDAVGTFGALAAEHLYWTLERPKTGEHPCIPLGEYDVKWTTDHPHHPDGCYEIQNVPGRTAILIHSANWFQELLGCIALGDMVEIVEGMLPVDDGGTPIKQKGISGSKGAVARFVEEMEKKPFKLVIMELPS